MSTKTSTRNCQDARWRTFSIPVWFASLRRRFRAQSANQSVENRVVMVDRASREQMREEVVMFDGGNAACVDEFALAVRDADWQALHKRFKRCAKRRVQAEAEEIACLLEAEETKLWRRFGYATLLEYMERELDYSPHTANERLRVARALRELPQIELEFESGEMPFSVVRELTRVATPATEQQWIDASRGVVSRGVQKMVSGLREGALPGDRPDPKLVMHRLSFEVTAEVKAKWTTRRTALEAERGERITESEALEMLCDLDAGGGNGTKAPVQFAVTVCKDCDRSFINSGSDKLELDAPARERLLADVEYIGDLTTDDPERPRRMKRDGVANVIEEAKERRTKAKRLNDDSGRPGGPGLAKPERAKLERAKPEPAKPELAKPVRAKHIKLGTIRKAIPAAIERKVKARDGGCIVPGCRSRRNLHTHHLTPRCLGGGNESSNLGTLCGGHHLRLHDGLLIIRGIAPHRLEFAWKRSRDDDEIPLTTSPTWDQHGELIHA